MKFSILTLVTLFLAVSLFSCREDPRDREIREVIDEFQRLLVRNYEVIREKDIALKLLSHPKWYIYSSTIVSSEPNFSGEIVYLAPGDTIHALGKVWWIDNLKKNSEVSFSLPTQKEDVFIRQHRVAKDLICRYISDPKVDSTVLNGKYPNKKLISKLQKHDWFIVDECSVSSERNGHGELIRLEKDINVLANKYGFYSSPVKRNTVVAFSSLTKQEKQDLNQFSDYLFANRTIVCKYVSHPE